MKTNKNYEVRYNDIKKNGKTTICVRFAGKGSDGYLTDAYLPIVVKALKPSDVEIQKYGAIDPDRDQTGISEFCRLNLTKWQMVDAPKDMLPFVKRLVGKTLWLYFNGAERTWKFYDPDGCIARVNKEQYIIKGKLTEAKLTLINDITLKYDSKCYAPHNDDADNYGDESVHAVYDMKCKI